MPDNPTGWVGYGQWAGLNQAAEEELMQQALTKAQASESDAMHALGVAGNEARDANSTQLSTAASYGQYLKARQAALGAYAAVTGPTGSPWEDALRRTADPTLVDKGRAGEKGSAFDEAEAYWGSKLASHARGATGTSTPVPTAVEPEPTRAENLREIQEIRGGIKRNEQPRRYGTPANTRTSGPEWDVQTQGQGDSWYKDWG